VIVDGNDVLAVYQAVSQAAKAARAAEGPTFIEGKTYRQRGHYEGDPQVYRTPEEIAEWRARDPLPAFRRRLVESGVFDEGTLEEIEGDVLRELDEAVAFAAEAEMPDPAEALYGVYGNSHDGLVF
jgi:pyruvate dehydrogenase E1 component alpha subunit